ncbi:hypothetical protein [Streptomyces sp. NPDC002779]
MTEQPRDPTGTFETERSAEIVAASFAGAPDARLREILTSLVRHATPS